MYVRTDGRTFLPGLLGHLSGDDIKTEWWVLVWLLAWGKVQVCIWPS